MRPGKHSKGRYENLYSVRIRLDRTALITGGAAGIGKATAARFLEEGARVDICDINPKAGDAAVQELGSGIGFHQVDVTARQSVHKWVDAVMALHRKIDILVNNAGILRDRLLVKFRDGEPIHQMPPNHFRVHGNFPEGMSGSCVI